MSAPWDTAPRTPAAGRKRHTDNPDPGLGALLARVVEWNKLLTPPTQSPLNPQSPCTLKQRDPQNPQTIA